MLGAACSFPGENARSWGALGEARPGQSSLSAGALRYRAGALPLRQTQRSPEGPRHLHRIPRLSEELQYFGHLMRSVDPLEKTLMLGGIGAFECRVPKNSKER